MVEQENNLENGGTQASGPQIFTQNGPNGLPVYYQMGENDQPIYYQIGENGQPIFLKLAKPAAPVGKKGEKGKASAAPVKKKKKKRRIWLFILELLILIALGVGLYAAAAFSKIKRVELPEEEIVKEYKQQLPTHTVEQLQGYWTIALYGIDSRDTDTNGQSDTIMVCSINKDTKEVKLASIFRDSFLDSDGTFMKATDIYGAYGVDRSIRTLNRNLDLDMSDFITVNMDIVAHVVDAIGGIEVDVETPEEVVHLNNYQVEGSKITGLPIIPVEETGLQLLNGLQALSYCRIRYTQPKDEEHPGLDYERTMRQRKVLGIILDKVKTMDYLTLAGIINKILPDVSTSLEAKEILELAKGVTQYQLVDTTGWPFEKQTGETVAGDCVVPVDLAQNVQELHEFLYADEDYEVSEMVQEIGENIAYSTGIY